MKFILSLVQKLMREPFLKNAEALRDALTKTHDIKLVCLSRKNQLSVMNVNSLAQYAMKERIVDAFEGTIQAAVDYLAIKPKNHKDACFLFNQNPPRPGWSPDKRLKELEFGAPLLRLWSERNPELAKVVVPYGDENMIVTAMIRDSGGMSRHILRHGFLEFNSSLKLDVPFVIGCYGMGGSSALNFCDYTLVLTRQRGSDYVSCALIFAKEGGIKQEFERFWFADKDEMPLCFDAKDIDFNELRIDEKSGERSDHSSSLSQFGTLVFHIGYSGSGWTAKDARRAASPIVFFKEAFASYPLDFYIQQEGAGWEEHTNKYGRGGRPGSNLLYRINEDKVNRCQEVTKPYVFNGRDCGSITVQASVFPRKNSEGQTHFSDVRRNVLYTQYGVTQGFDNFTLLNRADYYHLQDGNRVVVEVKFDNIHTPILSRLIQPSREALHNNPYVIALQDVVVDALNDMLDFRALENALTADSTEIVVVDGLWDDEQGVCGFVVMEEGEKRKNQKLPQKLPTRMSKGHHSPEREPLPINNPPTYIEFVSKIPIKILPNNKKRVYFATDADRKKFTFSKENIGVELSDASGESLTTDIIQIVKTRLRSTGRGFVDLQYTGGHQFKRTSLCKIKMFLYLSGQGKNAKFILSEAREIYTKIKNRKSPAGAKPQVARLYAVPNKAEFLAEYPNGIPAWGIKPNDIVSFDDSACIRLGDGFFPEALAIAKRDRPPMSYFKTKENKVIVEFNVVKIIDDLIRLKGRNSLKESRVFETYIKAVCYKAACDWAPRLSMYPQSLADGTYDLKDDDTEKVVRRAFKNHADALQKALDIEKAYAQTAG